MDPKPVCSWPGRAGKGPDEYTEEEIATYGADCMKIQNEYLTVNTVDHSAPWDSVIGDVVQKIDQKTLLFCPETNFLATPLTMDKMDNWGVGSKLFIGWNFDCVASHCEEEGYPTLAQFVERFADASEWQYVEPSENDRDKAFDRMIMYRKATRKASRSSEDAGPGVRLEGPTNAATEEQVEAAEGRMQEARMQEARNAGGGDEGDGVEGIGVDEAENKEAEDRDAELKVVEAEVANMRTEGKDIDDSEKALFGAMGSGLSGR